ncbi:MAG TPA: hypothetical protein VMB78_07965 [Dissulfurispiraceae bacterium]|nr:hypothetical protein [Dissulfurispiraceae bacterium]
MVEIALPYLHGDAKWKGITGWFTFFKTSAEMNATQALFLHFGLLAVISIV